MAKDKKDKKEKKHKNKDKSKDKANKKDKKNGKVVQPASPPVSAGETYADGTPLDKVTYLEAKLILKPDRFTSVQAFRDFGKLVQKTAKKIGVGFIADPEAGRRPQIREITFGDTVDFRLYNNAFILRRRVFPTWTASRSAIPKSSSSSVTPTRTESGGHGRSAQDRRKVSHQVQGRGASAERPRSAATVFSTRTTVSSA